MREIMTAEGWWKSLTRDEREDIVNNENYAFTLAEYYATYKAKALIEAELSDDVKTEKQAYNTSCRGSINGCHEERQKWFVKGAKWARQELLKRLNQNK